jgi:hypothetical protein
MTITNQHVEPVAVAPFPGGLLSTARTLSGDWRGGVTFRPIDGTTGVWGCINDGSEKTINPTADPFRVDPFMVYAGFECDGPIEDQLEADARVLLERTRSAAVARELIVSDPVIGNESISTVGIDITTTPQSLRDSIAGFMSVLSTPGKAGEVMLHVPYLAVPYFEEVGIEWRDNGWFLGPIPVSVDAYPNWDGDPPTDDDNAYIYMTRPVEYALGEVQPFGGYSGRINNAVVVAEQLAIVRFEPTFAYGIDVDFGAP